MVLYYIFLLILFLVYFFFAYDLTLRLEIDFNSIKVKVFYITIFHKKKEKYYKFLQKFIPKDQNQIKEEIGVLPEVGNNIANVIYIILTILAIIGVLTGVYYIKKINIWHTIFLFVI